MIGEAYLEDDFNMASVSMITVGEHDDGGHAEAEGGAVRNRGRAERDVDERHRRCDDAEEMLPDDLQKFFYNDSGATMLIVQFENPSAHEITMAAQREIKDTLSLKLLYRRHVGDPRGYARAGAGGDAALHPVRGGRLAADPVLSLRETVIPLLFMAGMLFPIAYNFGTNIFLGQISYITEALATVLQLGVTMDFSIFLLHRFEEERDGGADDETAMVRAVQKTFSSISASSLTTIAGFLALCTMRLTLGMDIGLVMAKGVLLGVICTR